MTDRFTIAIADDHSIVRHAFKTMLEADQRFAVVGECEGYSDTLRLLETSRPDMLLLDLTFQGRSGLEILHALREKTIPTRAVVITMHEEERMVMAAMAAGASAYLLKSSRSDEILEALNAVASQGTFIPQRYKHLFEGESASGSCPQLDPLYKLSAREREVFFLLVEGLPNRVIAKKLFVSPRTVETHRARLIKKLNVQSSAELIRFAIRNGLIGV